MGRFGEKILVVLAMVVLAISVFAEVASSNPQPPVVEDTLFVGRLAWGPRYADPAFADDLNSRELIFNVYNTLIFIKDDHHWEFMPCLATNVPSRENGTILDVTKTVESFDCNPYNPTGSNWSDGSMCVGWVDNHNNGRLDAYDVLYMAEPDGSYRTWFVQQYSGPELPIIVTLLRQQWIFYIRSTDVGGNPIYFVNESGDIVDTFDVSDVEYSFKRALVRDFYGKTWMLYKPLFDQYNSDPWDTGNPSDAYNLAHLIDNAIEVVWFSREFDVIINVGIPFPETALKQIFSGTWASIVSKSFSISIGDWDGDLYSDRNGNGYPDWWDNVRRKPSPYNTQRRYVGTGPYRVTLYEPTNYRVWLEKNPYYWGWNPSNVPGGRLVKIELIYNARLEDFLNGSLDIWPKPISNPPSGIIVFPDKIPQLTLDSLHFTFTVNPNSALCPRLRNETGLLLPTFFNNTHTRKAFCYSLDRTKYIELAYNGNAVIRNSFLVYNLFPDYYDPNIPSYYASFEKAKEELRNAIFYGQNLWEAGFWMGAAYDTGNYYRMILLEMIRDFFRELAVWGGFPPEHFNIEIIEVDWPTYLEMLENFEHTLFHCVYYMGFPFSDADVFARPYMHSYGDYAYFQNYTCWNGWGTRKDELVDMASKTLDGPERAVMYKELQWIYYDDAAGLPLAQPLGGGRSMWYWVKGWWYNLLYPGDYYYSMLKLQTCWYDISGEIWGVPDGICNFRDITYLILHFNAKPCKPNWVGTYGWGGVDPYPDRICNMRDITYCILHFGHTTQP